MHFLRTIALALAALSLSIGAASAAATNASAMSAIRISGLQNHIDALAQRARPGTLGVAVLDLQSGIKWRTNANQAFPMMSVFKAPLAAAVLGRVEHGELSMDQTVTIRKGELESGTIRDQFQGEQMQFTVRELLTDAVSKSDNTAADALLKLLGGPKTVTSFLQNHSISGLRVDLGESGVSTVFSGLDGDQQIPANETDAAQLARFRRGYAAYLSDPRNRSTPDAAMIFLEKLWRGKLLSSASSKLLLDLMAAQAIPSRLRAGLPQGVRLADKCGTSYTLEGATAAFNDIGILTWPDGRVVIVAAFLTASAAPLGERNAIFADLAREVATALHP